MLVTLLRLPDHSLNLFLVHPLFQELLGHQTECFLSSFIPGVNDLVVYVSFGGHVQLVFGALVGCKD